MIADRAETSALNSPHVTNRGYLGYEIARKAKAISDERIRRLLFLLHQRAKQDGGLGDVASELLDWLPERSFSRHSAYPKVNHPFRESTLQGAWRGHDLDALQEMVFQGMLPLAQYNDLVRGPSRDIHCFLEKDLVALLVEEFIKRPSEFIGADASREKAVILELLLKYLDVYPDRICKDLVVTTIGRRIHEAIEYAREAKGIVLIEGPSRIGKSTAARDWMKMHPDKGRYMELEACSNEATFYAELTMALCNGYPYGQTAAVLKSRIKETLQNGDLVLILDEAHWLWGHTLTSLPGRILWIMTALVNREVPVVLITTPQFKRSQGVVEKNSAWTSEQFTGRITEYIKLPDRLSQKDLRQVALFYLPNAEPESVQAVVAYAQTCDSHLQAIKNAAQKAKALAHKDGLDYLTMKHVKRAIQILLHVGGEE